VSTRQEHPVDLQVDEILRLEVPTLDGLVVAVQLDADATLGNRHHGLSFIDYRGRASFTDCLKYGA